MIKSTLAMSLVIKPITNVFSAIRPPLLTFAITEASLPLTGVNGIRFKCVGLFLDPLGIWVIFPIRIDCFPRLKLREVLARASSRYLEPIHFGSDFVAAPPRLHFDRCLVEFLFLRRHRCLTLDFGSRLRRFVRSLVAPRI